MRTMRALFVIITALLLMGGSALALPGGTAAQELAQTYDGSWNGTTSQGRPLGFAVQGNLITGVSFGYDMRPQCGVSGTTWVLLSSGAPITGNTFTASSQGFGSSALSSTLSGSFSSPDEASGTLQLSYVSSFPNTPCQATKTVTWSATRAADTGNYTISGMVRDQNGVPVEGAQLVVFPDQAGQPPFTGQSGAGGAYSLSVPAGTYDLQASKSGYRAGPVRSTTVPPDKTEFDLSLGTRTETFYTISGTVRDSTGSLLAGAQVIALPLQAGQPITAQTAANGSYSLSVPAGSYGVGASKAGYQPATPLSVSVPPNQSGADFTLTLLQPTTYTIGGAVRDSGGTPIASAQVVAIPTQAGGSPVSATTGPDGSYSLSVAAGTYSVGVSKSGYQPAAPLSVSVPPSRAGADFDLISEQASPPRSRVYLPMINRPAPPSNQPTDPPTQGGALTLISAQESNRLTCRGFPETVSEPRPGFTFLVVKVTVRKQQEGTFAVATNDFTLTAPGGSPVQPDGTADDASTGCPGRSMVSVSPNETMELGLVFVVRKELIGQQFSLRLKDGEPLRFSVTKL